MTKPLTFYVHYVDHYPAELYGGISNGVARRTRSHASAEKPYFEHFRVTVVATPFPPGTTRQQALDYERRWIDQHRPPFNNQHNPDYSKQQYLRSRIMAGAASQFVPSSALARAVDSFKTAAAVAIVAMVGAVAGALAVVL